MQQLIEAKTWLVALACRKAKELGYPRELWTTRLLSCRERFARDSAPEGDGFELSVPVRQAKLTRSCR